MKWFVTTMCRPNILLQGVAWPVQKGDLLPQRFAATCQQVCTNLLQEVKSNGNSKTVTPNSSRGR